MLATERERCCILLDQAWFCESCRAISNDVTCPSCASDEHTQRLAPWLDREPVVRVHSGGLMILVFNDPGKPVGTM